MKNLILIPILALLASCASLQKAQPYFEVVASIGTQQVLAHSGSHRAEYVAIIQEVGSIVQTLSTGMLLSPEQFNAELNLRVPAGTAKDAILPVVAGAYAVAYVDFKDRPELKNDYINRIASIILANAH